MLARRPAQRARRASGVGRRVGFGPLGVELLELDRRDVADRGVKAVVVEPADPLDDRQLGLLDRAPGAVGDQLGLEGVDERLGQGVVVSVPGRAEGAEDVALVEGLGELGRGVLRAAIGRCNTQVIGGEP